ncbi:MAG TPA: ACT domain-containing protein [Gaiellaceae bacterium]|nr:ACT domain-containing protein [Gaiellaceae bacterium]
MQLRTLPDSYAVVRLEPGSELPDWVDKGPFRSVTRTEHEVSVVCRDPDVPEGESVDRGWTVLEVRGPLDFSLTGVIASLVEPLAQAEVPIFLISTFETDYVLVRSSDLARAVDALEDAGHVFAA